MRIFLSSILSLFLFCVCLVQAKKNVLFIGSDDLRPNLGPYNEVNQGVFRSPRMHTPNIDKLASRSLLLEQAYVQQAVCSPSRSSLLTSRRPDTTHVTDLHCWFREVGGNFTTIPQFFKENGYRSINVGKIFHHGPEASGPGGDDNISWSEIFHAGGKDIYRGNGNSWESVSKDKKPLVDTFEGAWVANRLKELAPAVLRGEENFFIGWGLHRPHLPFMFPEEFSQFYPEDDINLPSNPFAPHLMPVTAWSNWGELRNYPDIKAIDKPHLGDINVTLPESKVLELRRAYYSSISHVDSEIGKVLEALEEVGLADSTIVMFWGDHGWQLGEHSEWCKHTNFEVAAHAPLMFHMPGQTDLGLRSSELVEFVDMFPTLVEAAGFPPLPLCPEDSSSSLLCTEGSSLLPLLEAPAKGQWKELVFWQYPRGGNLAPHIKSIMGYSLRSKEWRYTEWVGITYLGGHDYIPDWNTKKDDAELYSLSDDPQENVNLALDPLYAEVVNELSQKLRAGWRAARPQTIL